MTQNARRRWIIAAATAAIGLPAALSASPAAAAGELSSRVFTSGTATMTQPDDITWLDGAVYVVWQNGIGPSGQPSSTGVTDSTIVAYSTSGRRVARWRVAGHADGLAADSARDRLIVTVNEDGNSSLYTISPEAPPADQVEHYQFNLSPLPHGGGTDAVSVYHGTILISASAPTVTGGPAVYRARLEAGGMAVLEPVFFDDSQARVANVDTSSSGRWVDLALTDPDSNVVVPKSSPRFGGDFMLNSQGDEEQIYVGGDAGRSPRLSVLDLSQAVDDTAWVTDTDGTLLVTDSVDNEVFAIRGEFDPGTAYVAVTPRDANNPINLPNYLGRLNLHTGEVSPADTTIQAKGLLFIP
ncbi:MAG TPA: hypothetical protein VFV02_09105 [Acidimicrobiales bacterium]|nr:hypothetical protein [Acidimicrobiales bacterium]